MTGVWFLMRESAGDGSGKIQGLAWDECRLHDGEAWRQMTQEPPSIGDESCLGGVEK